MHLHTLIFATPGQPITLQQLAIIWKHPYRGQVFGGWGGGGGGGGGAPAPLPLKKLV